MVFVFGLNPDEITKNILRSVRHGFSSPTVAVQLGPRTRFVVMKIIKVKNSKRKILVDDFDYELVKNYTWYVMPTGYVARGSWSKNIQTIVLLHRQILGAKRGQCVDHSNHNKLDNRRANIRICTQQENGRNQLKTKSKRSSKYKGVCWHKYAKRWMAHITIDLKLKYIGVFKKESDAAAAYNAMATKVFGGFACLNKI